MNNPDSTSHEELRAKAHEAMDAYLDAGGSFELYILSQSDVDRNFSVALDTALQTKADKLLECLPEKLPKVYFNRAWIYPAQEIGYNNAIDQCRQAIKEQLNGGGL